MIPASTARASAIFSCRGGGPPAGSRPRARGRVAGGFTLIELLVVVAVVAILAAASAPAVASLSGANARRAAGEMAGAMRWLFDTAALRHTTCRLALDLDHGAFWAECAEATEARRAPALGGPADEEVLADRFPGERSAEVRRLLARTPFGEFSDRTVKRRELPGGASLAEVWTPARERPVDKGMAYVHFFPRGEAEAARVTLADGNHAYTVTLEPLTGRARVAAGRPEAAR